MYTVTNSLTTIGDTLINWFHYNHRKANADKCHLFTSKKCVEFPVGGSLIESCSCEKLLGVTIDSDLKL